MDSVPSHAGQSTARSGASACDEVQGRPVMSQNKKNLLGSLEPGWDCHQGTQSLRSPPSSKDAVLMASRV